MLTPQRVQRARKPHTLALGARHVRHLRRARRIRRIHVELFARRITARVNAVTVVDVVNADCVPAHSVV